MQRGKDGEPPIIPTPTNCRTHCCNITGLICSSCQIGKGSQRGSGAKYLVEVDPGALHTDDLVPGQKVLVDQFVSKVKGRLAHTYGKEKTTDMYDGGAIF
eukprot:10878435-Ditylum_brightwellii.AAC.2